MGKFFFRFFGPYKLSLKYTQLFLQFFFSCSDSVMQFINLSFRFAKFLLHPNTNIRFPGSWKMVQLHWPALVHTDRFSSRMSSWRDWSLSSFITRNLQIEWKSRQDENEGFVGNLRSRALIKATSMEGNRRE